MADEQRDNRNSGVFFAPRDGEMLVGSGKLDIEGKERRVIAVKQPVKHNGDPELVLYAKIAVLWRNDPEKIGDKGPTFAGQLELGENLRVAGWPGEKDERRYVSLRVSKDTKSEKAAANSPKAQPRIDDLDDSIPF